MLSSLELPTMTSFSPWIYAFKETRGQSKGLQRSKEKYFFLASPKPFVHSPLLFWAAAGRSVWVYRIGFDFYIYLTCLSYIRHPKSANE